MVLAFEDIAPNGDDSANYDREHSMLYVCPIDRNEKGRDWRETVQAFFGIDSDQEPERARRVYDSHLARATALLKTPELASLYHIVPLL